MTYHEAMATMANGTFPRHLLRALPWAQNGTQCDAKRSKRLLRAYQESVRSLYRTCKAGVR